LMSIKIVKGAVQAEYRQREEKAYFIQNNSGADRSFTIDHVIRPEWRLMAEGKVEKGPGVHRVVVKVAEGKTATEGVTEEDTIRNEGPRLGALPEAKLREFLAAKATPDAVRQAVERVLAYQTELAKADRSLKENQARHKELSDDQARVRENLKILPQDSAPYRRFLEKVDTQETGVEGIQAPNQESEGTSRKTRTKS